MRMIDREEVAARLGYEVAIPLVREAMVAFSSGETRQLLRSILPLSEGRLFGVMPGALGPHAPFGAKLISVFKDNFARGIQSHQGVIVLYEPDGGAPVAVVDAGEVTAIRTGAASAVATEALSRVDSRRMAILGYGEQAGTHARAISRVRRIAEIAVWGRSPERAAAFAAAMSRELGLPVRACATAEAAVSEADVVCTVTAASEPVLKGAWLKAGAHVNVVGSSYAGPVEVDEALVVMSRFFVDSREGVLAQGAEFLKAKASGAIGDDHILGEIGEVLAGRVEGRRSSDEITVYKSLGHVAQDLACAWALYAAAR